MSLKTNLKQKKAYTLVEIMIVISIMTVLLTMFFLVSMRRAGSMKDKIQDVNALRLQEKKKIDLQVEVDQELKGFRSAMEAEKTRKLLQGNVVTPAVYRISKGVNYSGVNDGKTSQLVKKLLDAATLKIQANQLDEALKLLNEASTLEAFDPKISLELAKLFWQSGRMDHAQESLSNALVLDPEYADAHLLKARLFIRNGQLDMAKKSIVMTENLKHSNADIMLVWSEFYSKKGNKQESKLYLDKYKYLLGKDVN
ncbi:tetratricopeptide repeat protein [bacterium]|nr:tetratricopeptide repeat protein [bacterium]